MSKTRINYKGYTSLNTSDNIIMLFVPQDVTGTTHHALSFDNGETWCISNCKNTVCTNFTGSFTDAIDVCVELNKENQNEE